LLLVCSTLAAPAAAQTPQTILNRAVADFEDGRFAESAAGFDTLVTLVPEQAPYLWQRGIALYYAKRYDDCRRQFESHRLGIQTTWRIRRGIFSASRAESPAKARQRFASRLMRACRCVSCVRCFVAHARRSPLSHGRSPRRTVLRASLHWLYFEALGMNNGRVNTSRLLRPTVSTGGYAHGRTRHARSIR
jgi:hypothetical protein